MASGARLSAQDEGVARLTPRRGIVLSWSDNAGGNGHVNLRTNEWVVQRMGAMGYVHDEAAELALRHAVTDIHWFRTTLMAFRRKSSTADGGGGSVEARAF